MVQDYYTLLTPAGLEAVTYAIATETAVDFAFIAVGDANGTTYFPTGQERTLKNEVWRGPITNYAIKPENPNWLKLEASIPGNIGGFSIKEAGIFDSDNVLLAIGKPPEAYKPQLNQGAAMDLRVIMTLEVTNADRVIINIDPSIVYVTKEYVDNKDDTHANIKATTAQYGHTKLLNSVTSTANDLAATPNAVKTAYDKASSVETNATNHAKDTVLHTYYNTAGGSANAKTVTLSPAPVGLVDGMAVVFKNTTANTGAVTLNVNNLGAKAIVKANGKALSANNLAVNGIYTVRYNATTGNFILQGEGSETTLEADNILIGEQVRLLYITGIMNNSQNTNFNKKLTVNSKVSGGVRIQVSGGLSHSYYDGEFNLTKNGISILKGTVSQKQITYKVDATVTKEDVLELHVKNNHTGTSSETYIAEFSIYSNFNVMPFTSVVS